MSWTYSSGTLTSTAFTQNGQGKIITEGFLAGLDTSMADAGDPVWLSPVAGELLYGLANKPVAPNHMVFIGIVLRSNSNNGEIYVKIQNGFEFEELHNVSITEPKNGQVPSYENGLWKNKFTWDYLVTNWSVEPTINTTITGGEVYNYTLNGTTRYRFVPTTYNPTQDAFYTTFDGTTLTNLIAKRG